MNICILIILFVPVLQMFFVPGPELINAACCINKFHLACVKRVRCMRYFKFYKRIFLAIIPNNCFPGLYC